MKSMVFLEASRRQTFSNRHDDSLFYDIKRPSMEMGSQKFSHGKLIHGNELEDPLLRIDPSVVPTEWLDSPTQFLLDEHQHPM